MMIRRVFSLLMIVWMLAGCAGETPVATGTIKTPAMVKGGQASAPTTTQVAPTVIVTATDAPGTGDQPGLPTQRVAPTAAPVRDAQNWRAWPVIPAMTDGALEIFARGQALGNDAARFSKIGDCETSAAWFLADFDGGAGPYSLGEYDALEAVIEHFRGSYGRVSLAAKPGATAASLLTPLWADREQCGSTESPLECELRVHKPAFAFVLVGSNDVPHRARFEENLRKVIERTIELGVVPVLATKADNLEGDDSINATIARLAVEYDLPLWNFWLAVQPLPDHGLQPDAVHLTWASNQFDDAQKMQKAWPVRNLTALQTLDALWKGSE